MESEKRSNGRQVAKTKKGVGGWIVRYSVTTMEM